MSYWALSVSGQLILPHQLRKACIVVESPQWTGELLVEYSQPQLELQLLLGGPQALVSLRQVVAGQSILRAFCKVIMGLARVPGENLH